MEYREIEDAAALVGLLVRGGVHPGPADGAPEYEPGAATRTIVLLGSVGAAGWPAFAAGRSAGPNPLERWTRARVEPIAQRAGARAVYPDDRPYLPFLRWARGADDLHTSPLGLLIHPQYGLWHSYRAALLLPVRIALPARSTQPSPCDTCANRPCLQACPVGAYRGDAFDSAACRTHLATPAGQDCLQGGCKARNACPVGSAHRYAPEQIRFHMAAFNSPAD